LSNLIIFDLDGVITSEDAYWDVAGLTLHEFLYSPRYWNVEKKTEPYRPAATAEESRCVSRATLPESAIMALKARAINSNWDTCYAGVCLHLIDLLAQVPDITCLLPLKLWDADWLATFRRELSKVEVQIRQIDPVHIFTSAATIFHGYVGLELINRFDAYANEVLGHAIEGVFSRHSPFWPFCQDIFQEWYLGDELYTRDYGHAPAQPGKPGCIHFEQPLLPVKALHITLRSLREQGYVLGFATGRPFEEAEVPLEMQGLLQYFDERHISTHDYVVRAEAELRSTGDQTLLGKPHPFPFFVALNQNYRVDESRSGSDDFIVVGDSTGDMLGGRAAGAITVAVLTGARTSEARGLLEQSHPDFTIRDVTELPTLLAQIDSLATIQRLQISDREKAERLLRRWFARHMNLNAESVRLTPKPVSLNSFNGFYRIDGEEYFFKTHVEEQGSIQEYYHAELLHRAGYNMVMPLQTLHEEGRQMVIYPVVRWPVMFDLMRSVEIGDADEVTIEMLTAAERNECEHLLNIFQETLTQSTAEEHAQAPVHQLFWHRLTGGRLTSFYHGKNVMLPGGASELDFEELLGCQWVINGVEQRYTLGELIERAKVVLSPARAAMTIVGHGDAHFGNVFLENQSRYLYFDPAFAGRHSPLLEIVKPFFHNVFATWMYFPHEIARDLRIDVKLREETLFVEYNYTLTPVRRAILQTKIEHLLTPLIMWLDTRNGLPDDWLEILQLALLCCPLLTINLIDRERMPPTVSWLGLLQAVQMGNSGIEPWRRDL
jgi:phosphoglycolate phosphatase-like HAD superfamily hydrolase